MKQYHAITGSIRRLESKVIPSRVSMTQRHGTAVYCIGTGLQAAHVRLSNTYWKCANNIAMC